MHDLYKTLRILIEGNSKKDMHLDKKLLPQFRNRMADNMDDEMTYNLFHEIVPLHRTCEQSGITSVHCKCKDGQKAFQNVPVSSDPILALALNESIIELNERGHSISPSICQKVHFAGETVPQLVKHIQSERTLYSLTFQGKNGGAIFESQVQFTKKEKGKLIPKVTSLQQTSTYNVYDQCIPKDQKNKLSPKFCICS